MKRSSILEAIGWIVITLAFTASVAFSQTTDPARASYRVWVNNGDGSRSGGSSTGI